MAVSMLCPEAIAGLAAPKPALTPVGKTEIITK
jgi:uncharacterized protein YbbK (DUF523 family)